MYRKLKNLSDIVLGLFLFIALSPLMLIISIMNLIYLGGPIFFTQKRIGLGEKPFMLYKFRTMSNAKDSHGNYLPDEDRLGWYGSFLRRYSLDELPQVINIIKGDMSFVGPRPLLPEYLPYYSKEQAKRHDVKPGLTGLAQISGRNELSWEEKFIFDVNYVLNYDLLMDIKILYKTFFKVFSPKGISHAEHVTMPRFDKGALMPTANSSAKRIFLSPPHMTGNELSLIKEVFDSNYIAPLGPMVDRLEKEICEYTGYPFAVAVNSGTAALHLSLMSLGIKPGDVVWASSFTFIASVSPILFCQGVPVFFDSSDKDWNIDCDLIEESLINASKQNKLPKAILATDLYGQPCDYERLNQLCETYGVSLVIDAAESLGSSFQNNKTTSPIVTYSFNGNKIITSSGGGVLASHDKKIVEHARFLSQQAREPFPYYQHEHIGHNYRMSNVLAAIAVAQLGALDERVQQKKNIFESYEDLFAPVNGISMMPIVPGRSPNYWLSAMLIDPDTGVTPEDVRLRLEEHNIEARPLWKPMHLQPVFKNCAHVGGKVSESLFAQGLCLPSGTSMTREDIERVANIIKEIF